MHRATVLNRCIPSRIGRTWVRVTVAVWHQQPSTGPRIPPELRHPSASCYRRPHLWTVGACGIASSLSACSTQPSIFSTYIQCYCFTNLYSGTLHARYTNLHGGTQPANRSLVYPTHPPPRLWQTSVQHVFSTAKVDGAWLTLISIPNRLRLHAPLTVVPTSHLYPHSCG